MTAIVTREMVAEDNPHGYVAEASTLGIPPGVIPRKLETTLGNTLPLLLVDHDDSSMTYRQRLGCIELTVLKT